MLIVNQPLCPLTVVADAEYGLDPDAKEAIAFAVLAYESFHGRPGNIPRATGARAPVILGKAQSPAHRKCLRRYSIRKR
jgi:anhydro-N-acetylmuramic acid kinase